jgi:P-type E1-E2 ATPase
LLGRLRPTEAILVSPEKGSDMTISGEKGAGGVLRTEVVAVDMLEVGDVVRVLPGSSPPSDGTIISDEGTNFDESSLTGESRPVAKRRGDDVFAGTINQTKAVSVRVNLGDGETMY